MLVLASVTDSLVTFATHVIHDLGLPGVFLLVGVDALGVPIPAAAILLFAGFNVSEGHDSVLGVTAAGVLGDVAGSCVAYAIGATGGHELLARHGRRLHVTPAQLETTHRWFERWGAPVVFVGRSVPFVRTYIAYPAGVAQMRFHTFVLATALGAIPVCLVWTLVGRSVGSSWTDWRDQLAYVDYAVVALLALAAAYAAFRWLRSRIADAPV
jgi:membrane protein DedA with SNARE-associated domain